MPNIDHNPQPSGKEEEYLNDYGDTLAGYTSPGGSIRVHKEMMRLVFYAVAAELPNKAVLKAKQDAYDQVMRQAEDVLGKQRQAYETQCQKMAREHESCMERMRQENERMLQEATKVREEYTKAFLLEPQPSMLDITLSQQRVHNDVLASRLDLKAKRHLDDYMAEKHKRERKEEDLRLAEEQITKLKEHLRQLEDIIDGTAKRPMPPREEGDSPEMHVNKRGRTDEVPLLALATGTDVSGGSVIPKVVPIPAEPFPREGKPATVPVLKPTKSGVPVLDSAKPSVPVLDSSKPNYAKLGSLSLTVLKGQIKSQASRRSDPVAFVPSPAPSDAGGCNSETKGYNRLDLRVENKPRPAYREGYYTDEELQTQSLEAWRARLRAMHDYIPDRMWDKSVHLDRVKILQAALSNFKGERETGKAMKLHGRALAEYPHGRYESLQKQYKIPQEVCPPKELMGNLTQNEDILYRFRCCPVNR